MYVGLSKVMSGHGSNLFSEQELKAALFLTVLECNLCINLGRTKIEEISSQSALINQKIGKNAKLSHPLYVGT